MSAIKPIKIQLYRIIFWQLIMIMGLAVLLFLLSGLQKGLSALLGGIAYWLPSVIFMVRIAAYATARAADRFIVAFFAGEAIKLILSGTLFIIIVKYLSVNVFYALMGMIGAIVAFWVASLVSVFKQGVRL